MEKCKSWQKKVKSTGKCVGNPCEKGKNRNPNTNRCVKSSPKKKKSSPKKKKSSPKKKKSSPKKKKSSPKKNEKKLDEFKNYKLNDRRELYKKVKNDIKKNQDMKVQKQIGKGVYGVVFRADINNNIVAVKKQYLTKENYKSYEKYLTNPFDKNVLVDYKDKGNELFVDLAASRLLGELVIQNICPHFVLNYGYSSKDDYMVMVNEYIENFQEIKHWEKSNHTSLEWSSVFFQILVGLFAMKDFYNMTHNDLHYSNILVQKIPKIEGGYFEYKIDGVKYYLPSVGWRVYINDYGLAYVKNKLEIKWYHFKKSYIKEQLISNDILRILDSLMFSKTPKTFRKVVLDTIKKYNDYNNPLSNLKILFGNFSRGFFTKDECEFGTIEKDLHLCFDIKPDNGKVIEKYDMDQRLDTSNIPKLKSILNLR
jgi:hypothetical protein